MYVVSVMLDYKHSLSYNRIAQPVRKLQARVNPAATGAPTGNTCYQNRLVHTTWAFFLSRKPISTSWLPLL